MSIRCSSSFRRTGTGWTGRRFFRPGAEKGPWPWLAGCAPYPPRCCPSRDTTLWRGGAVLPTIWANLGLILAGASIGDAPEPEPPPEGGTTDHRRLSHRDALEQHPIASISGLEKELNRIPEPVEALTNTELEEMLK